MLEPCEICGTREMHAQLRTIGKVYMTNLCDTCTAEVANWLFEQPVWQASSDMASRWDIMLASLNGTGLVSLDASSSVSVLRKDRHDLRRALFQAIKLQIAKLADEMAGKDTSNGT